MGRVEVRTAFEEYLDVSRALRPLGQPVRVSDWTDRYAGTKGTVCAHEPAFGTVLYRVRGTRVEDCGKVIPAEGWECLFFPNQLRQHSKGVKT